MASSSCAEAAAQWEETTSIPEWDELLCGSGGRRQGRSCRRLAGQRQELHRPGAWPAAGSSPARIFTDDGERKEGDGSLCNGF